MKLSLRDFSEVLTLLRGRDSNASGTELRRSARTAVTAKIEVHHLEQRVVNRTASVLTRDISASGMSFLENAFVTTGSEILLSLPRRVEPLFVRGVVQRCSPIADGIFHTAVEFQRVIDQKAMEEIVSSNRAVEVNRLQRAILD